MLKAFSRILPSLLGRRGFLPQRRPQVLFRALRIPLAAAIALATSSPGFAQTIDQTRWVTDGNVFAIARDASTVYLGGRFKQVSPCTGGGVSLDIVSGVPPSSLPRVTGAVYSVCPDGGGGWYVGGDFTAMGGLPRSNIAHIASDLSVSPWNPGANGLVRVLVVNGPTVYAGGQFINIGGQERRGIAALDASTGLATGWNPNANEGVRAILVNGSTVYAGGSFTAIGGEPRNYIAALDAATGLATAWNPNASAPGYTPHVDALALSGSTLFVGGAIKAVGGQPSTGIAAVDITTGLPIAWTANSNEFVLAMALSGPILYVGGRFSNIGGQARNRIAALNVATGAATSWNPNAQNDNVYALAVNGSTIYAGGEFISINSRLRNRVAAIDATTALPTAWNPNANGTVRAVAVSGSNVFVGGDFTGVGGVARDNVAALDAITGAATAWNPHADDTVYELELSGSVVYAGGGFTTIGYQPRNRIAALGASTGLATSWNPNANGGVKSVAVSGATVYVGGTFTNIGGQVRNYIAALDGTTGLATPWNPNAVATGYVPSVEALAVSANTVYAGGSFTTIGGEPRLHMAALDASTGLATPWDAKSDGYVLAMALSGSTLYLGGSFTAIGGQTRNRIAALDATTAEATAWDPNASGGYGYLSALEVSGSTIYAGGTFTTIGGQARNNLAALDASTGAALAAWNPNPNEIVWDIALVGSTVYSAGYYTRVGGQPQSYITAMSDAPTTVSAPSGRDAPRELALGFRSNPTRDDFGVTFALQDDTPARLELFDVSGRRIALREVGKMGAGSHVVTLGIGRRLAPGVYLLRLSQGSRSVVARGVILR